MALKVKRGVDLSSSLIALRRSRTAGSRGGGGAGVGPGVGGAGFAGFAAAAWASDRAGATTSSIAASAPAVAERRIDADIRMEPPWETGGIRSRRLTAVVRWKPP